MRDRKHFIELLVFQMIFFPSRSLKIPINIVSSILCYFNHQLITIALLAIKMKAAKAI